MFTLQAFLETEYWQAFEQSIESNLLPGNPERYERIQEHAVTGGIGSTHAEVIQDWCDAIFAGYFDNCITEEDKICLLDEIGSCEIHHEQVGTYDQVIG